VAIDFPNSPTVGQIFTSGSFSWRWDGTRWVSVAMGSSIAIGDTPPSSPYTGQLWWDSIGGQAYLYYQDPNTTQWVPLDNQAGSPLILPRGVVDGSNAAAGQVGEFVTATQSTAISLVANTATNITSISLTAGDWDVWGVAGLVSSAGVSANLLAGVNTVSGTLGPLGSYVQFNPSSGIVNTFIMATPMVRVNLTTTTTAYLIGYLNFASGTGSATGVINARRAR